MNSRRLEHLFEARQARKDTERLADLCNQLIHSYILEFEAGDTAGYRALYVASDYKRKRFLTRVDLAEVERLFRKVALAYPSQIHYSFDTQRGDYTIRAW
ncbi:MAG TPA: hypothetical protein VEA99_19880 [Gemmatimonadaceae bacterium]|nr:hypothetical protein [Gemmatimonadaceae bacterium]